MDEALEPRVKRVYRADCVIEAPPAEVWAVLCDLAAYPQWNPFTVQMRSTLVVGEPIDMRVSMWGGRRVVSQREIVRVVDAPRRLEWTLRMVLGVLCARRVQALEAVQGGTRYRTEDVMEGPLVPLVHLLFGASVQRGLEGVAEALVDRVRQVREANEP